MSQEPILDRLRLENRQFQDNFNELKQAHRDLEVKYECLTKELQLVLSEKNAFEKSHNIMVDEWKEQLDAKTREFDILREQMEDPRNIDVLRQQFLMEYEQTFKDRLQTVLKEVEKWKGLLFESQRQNEEIKLQAESREKDYRITLEDMAMAQEEQVFNYKLQLSEKTKALEEMPHLTKRSRDFQQKNVELTTRVKVLTSELENVQNIAVEDRARSEYQLKNIKQLLVEQEAICKTLTGEKEAQKMKMQRMEDELYSVQKALENSRSEASQLSVSLTKTQSRHDEIIHQFKIEAENINFAFVKERSEWQQKESELKKKLDSSNTQVETLNAQLTTKDVKLKEAERSTIDKVRVAREEEWTKQRQLDTEKRELESKLIEVNQQLQNEKAKAELSRRELAGELEQLRGEMHNLQTRNHSLVAQNEKLVAENESVRNELHSVAVRMEKSEQECSILKVDLAKVQKSEDDWRHKLDVLDQEYRRLQRDAMDREQQQQTEREQEKKQADECNLSLQKEKLSLQSSLDSALAEQQKLTTQYTGLINTTKKLRNGYKKRMEEASGEMKKMQDSIKQLQLENQSLQTRLDNENQTAKLRLKEMQRKQQDFKQLLQQEGISAALV